MRYRKLGRSELEVPVVSFGAWAIGGWNWGGTDDASAIDAIRTAHALGMNAIDTAPIYGFGHSERVVGEAIRGLDPAPQIWTKAGLRWDDQRGQLAFEGRGDDGRPVKIFCNSRPDSVRGEVEASLMRLGLGSTGRIDLLQIHWPDPTTPIDDTMRALVELVEEGRIRAVGVSNYSPAQMEEAQAALGAVVLASDQPRYSLIRREIEDDVLPWARANEVGLVCYSPLEQGLLTGKVPADREFGEDDGRRNRPTFQAENRARVNALLDEVFGPLAARYGATYAQLALAWLIAQPGVTSVIAGARNRSQVEENAAAADLELAPEELATIDRAFAELELDETPV